MRSEMGPRTNDGRLTRPQTLGPACLPRAGTLFFNTTVNTFTVNDVTNFHGATVDGKGSPAVDGDRRE
jgi:hypothetical protein